MPNQLTLDEGSQLLDGFSKYNDESIGKTMNVLDMKQGTVRISSATTKPDSNNAVIMEGNAKVEQQSYFLDGLFANTTDAEPQCTWAQHL